MSTRKRSFRKITEAKAKIIWQSCKQDPLTKKWKGVSKAARLTGLTRQTIYDFLQEHPEQKATRKIQPKYVEKWESSAGYQTMIDYFKKFKDVKQTTLNNYIRTAKEGWLYLRKKDPISWTLDDFLKLKENPAWFDVKAAKQRGLKPEEARISFAKTSQLRNVMEALGHKEWQDFFKTKKLKRAKGMKRQWWLRKDEVRAIASAIEDSSTKVLFYMACYTGSRISAYLNAKFGDLNLSIEGQETWEAFETKTGTPITKELNAQLVKLLKAYVAMMKKAGRAGHHDKMFPRGRQFYSDQLKAGAIRAGLCETGPDPNDPTKIVDDLMHGYRVSWHMTRHTFASQLLQEGASLQHVMQQGPWKSSDTLMTYYGGTDRTKIRASMNLLNFG